MGLSLVAGSQTVDINQRCKKAYSDIIALKFDSAAILIDEEKKQNPENLYPLYLENFINYFKAFISEDERYYEFLKDNKGEIIEKLDKLPDDNPYKNYLIGNIRFQYAMIGTKFGDYFSSAIEVRRSFLLIKKNIKKFPDFELQYSTMGVLHILVGIIPDKYDWILKLISLEGTVEQGMDELYQVLHITETDDNYSYLKPEILFYVAFIEMNLGLDEDKKEQLMKDLKFYEDKNLLLCFLRSNMLMKSGRNEEAGELLSKMETMKGYFPFYYLYYMQGETKLRKLDTTAQANYQIFINKFKGNNYLKDAQRKIAWTYLINYDTVGYMKSLEKVLSIGDDFVGIDKEAEKEAETVNIPNVDLLKSRLLFDGGYYSSAEIILDTINVSLLNKDEKLDRLYRLGRINQKTGNTDKAIRYFKSTIEQGRDSKRYFAGNAALQLGKIYEKEKQFDNALKYYKLCRELDFDEYETSIKEKAKQGIERIEN